MMLLKCNVTLYCLFFVCTVYIAVRFNPADYTVKEGVDSSAVITLEVLGDPPDFNFTVTVGTQDRSAICESFKQLSSLLHYYCLLLIKA